MAKKTLIEQYINRHTKELEDSIKSIEPKLIEAFGRVYGEKHRDRITSTIINMNYIFFISESYCDMFVNSKAIRRKDKYIMQFYLNYLKRQASIFNSVSPENQEEFIIKSYLSRYPFKAEDYSAFSDALNCDSPCCSSILYEGSEQSYYEFYICLPIFTIDLKTIIHEINHALNISVIGHTETALIMRCLFEKEPCEELVKDFIAELVMQMYIKIGGTIPKPLSKIKIGNEYEYKDYIVVYLFDCLIDLILESRISGNYNLFYNLVGKENTENLERMMEELYNNDYFDAPLYSELISLIDKIYEKVITANPIEMEKQIAELENA